MITTAIALFVLLKLAWTDWHNYKLPNTLTYSGMLVGNLWHGTHQQLIISLLGMIAGYISIEGSNTVYLYFRTYSPRKSMNNHRVITRALGKGDTKMLAMIGSWLGPIAIPPIIGLSSLLGCLYAGVIYVTRKKIPLVLPFGCFLSGATILLAGASKYC